MKRYFREMIPLRVFVVLIFGVVAILHGFAFAQDHAPTLEQCKADVNLWNNEFQHNGYVNVSIHELNERSKELSACLVSYPKDPSHGLWVDVHVQFHSVMEYRYSAFIARHNLFNKFMEEDKQGKR